MDRQRMLQQWHIHERYQQCCPGGVVVHVRVDVHAPEKLRFGTLALARPRSKQLIVQQNDSDSLVNVSIADRAYS